MTGLAYLDASAVVKLIVDEDETPALQADVIERTGLVASRLSLLEARRAIARRPAAPRIASPDDITRAVVMIEINTALLESAAAIQPYSLRSLDAIHLASALSAADPSIDIITYDDRLADAARAHGLTVVQPGR